MYVQIKARVHKESAQGTILQVLVPNTSLTDHIAKYAQNGSVPGTLWLDDGRTLTADQRRKCFATIRDISEWNGDDINTNHWWLKNMHIAKTGGKIFSMSDCSVTTARYYITFLLDFCLEWDVPLSESILDRADDIAAVLYGCLVNKKCCICGNPAEGHHTKAIGMGRNRKTIVHLGMELIALCRKHHSEAHSRGWTAFSELYHVFGIAADEVICGVYGLNVKKR